MGVLGDGDERVQSIVCLVSSNQPRSSKRDLFEERALFFGRQKVGYIVQALGKTVDAVLFQAREICVGHPVQCDP
jgi:hypothetical protein